MKYTLTLLTALAATLPLSSSNALEASARNVRDVAAPFDIKVEAYRAAIEASLNEYIDRNTACADRFAFYSPNNPAADAAGCITPNSSIPAGIIASFNGPVCPDGWAELTAARNRFIIGAGGTYSRGNTGGSMTATLAREHLPHTSIPIYAYKYVGADDAAAGNNASSIRFLASGRNTRSSSKNGGLGANVYSRTDFLGDGTPLNIAPPYLALLQCYKQ